MSRLGERSWRRSATSRHALPRTIRLQPITVVEESEEERLQNGAEYAADGLVPLVERLGEGPWLDRLREVVDEVIAHAAVETSHGPIPSTSRDQRQSAPSRRSSLSAHARRGQLEMMERIAAWYAPTTAAPAVSSPPRA